MDIFNYCLYRFGDRFQKMTVGDTISPKKFIGIKKLICMMGHTYFLNSDRELYSYDCNLNHKSFFFTHSCCLPRLAIVHQPSSHRRSTTGVELVRWLLLSALFRSTIIVSRDVSSGGENLTSGTPSASLRDR